MADKKAKLEEAIARGQLPLGDNPRFPKRPRLEQPGHGANRGRANHRGRGKKNGPPGGLDRVMNPKLSTTPTRTGEESLSLQPPLLAQPSASVIPEDYDSSDSNDAPPEALSTKNAALEPSPLPETSQISENTQAKSSVSEKPTKPGRAIVRQPRGPPPTPFGQNTSLLRNVRFSVRGVHIDRD